MKVLYAINYKAVELCRKLSRSGMFKARCDYNQPLTWMQEVSSKQNCGEGGAGCTHHLSIKAYLPKVPFNFGANVRYPLKVN